MLFNYINNLLFEVDKGNPDPVSVNCNRPVNCLAYADEILILAKLAVALQRTLDIVGSFCQMWRMTLITTETKCMTFQNKHRI